MKFFCFLTGLLLAMACITPLHARDTSSEDAAAPLYGFLHGTYHLIGRAPDSDRAYAGKMVLRAAGDRFVVTRSIQGTETTGEGRIETALAGETKVLRVRFRDKNRQYEATYLIGSDLDNYGRLTGYLYLAGGGGTTVPGLEALFIDLEGPDRK